MNVCDRAAGFVAAVKVGEALHYRLSSTGVRMNLNYESKRDTRNPRKSSAACAGVGLGFGILFTLPALLLGYISAGAGHGNYFFARALFPIAMAGTWVTGSLGMTALILAIVQWPAYGATVGYLVATRRFRWCWAIPLLHFLAFLIASGNENFS